MLSLSAVKFFGTIIIFGMTLLAGAYPFIKRLRDDKISEFPIAEALALGIFLGAALLHMMGDSTTIFDRLGINYPLPFFLAGSIFLVLLLFEHIGREVYAHRSQESPVFAVLAVIMLANPSFFSGAALGVSESLGTALVIFFAIVAHKWAASFALAVQINKCGMSARARISLFLAFATMVPLGIYVGDQVANSLSTYPYIQPCLMALAAGTFLYLGTLHGLNRAVMVDQCCDLRRFVYVILGYLLMAVVAIWV